MSIVNVLRGRARATAEHRRAAKAAIAAPGILGAAYIWLLLYVILSVPIWVAFIVAAVVAAAWLGATAALATGDRTAAGDPRRGDIVVGADAVQLNPLVNVRAVRTRFASAVLLMLFSSWLLIETLAFAVGTQKGISFASGIAVTAAAALAFVGYSRRSRDAKQSVVVPSLGLRFALGQAAAGLIALLGAWQIVATRVFSAEAVRWITFENGCLMLAIALGMLVVHEYSSERVVHVLEVAGWEPGQRDVHAAKEGATA